MSPSKRLSLFLLILLCVFSASVVAQNPDGVPDPETVTIAGTIQSKLGCSGDWQPSCEATFLTYSADTGLWQASFDLPSGRYEYKAALNGTWDVSYGLNCDGVPGSPNIPLVLDADTTVTFTYDHKTGCVTDSVNGDAVAQSDASAPPPPAKPDIVNIPGTIQPALGCAAEWAPNCEATFLTYDEANDVWRRTFDVPAGNYEYKVAINGSWAENYGGFADRDGPNIPLTVAEDRAVTFIYDHKTNWIADDVRHKIVTAVGDFQDELGCAADDQADCLRTWLQDVDGDGIYAATLYGIPRGDYTARAALGLSTDETYGDAQGNSIAFTVEDANKPVSFLFDANANIMVVSAGGSALSAANLAEARAHWVTADTIAWNIEANADNVYKLLYSPNATMSLSLFGLEGVEGELTLSVGDGLGADVVAKFPHLSAYAALQIAPADLAQVPDILKGQFAVAEYSAGGDLLNITSLQIPGVLDDLYTYDGPLGISWEDGIPTVRVWAPTAQAVRFHLFDDSRPRTEASAVRDMAYDAESGVWSITGEADWLNKFYLFEVVVFAPTTRKIETNLVTDPYSISLSTNSLRSQLVNLDDPALAPQGWADYEKPPLAAPEDIVVYEIHIRDFSAFDETVPQELRGTYLAFTQLESNGMKHLAALAQAGLTHLHILPTLDIATINENKARWFFPDYEKMAAAAPNSPDQQAELSQIRDLDPFNWGYDPFHYNVPEGSYATDPDGPARIREYRAMVQALNQVGLRVVADVVYNHTNASGQDNKSVLDRVVPGYYHRLDEKGTVARSTCCQNTATEHNMMRKLMVDSVVLWATAYKIDAFRFDLMGHHMKDDMLAVRAALDALTLEEHGVDGASIYIYGEGWNFGEVVDGARGVNATQINMAGTGIGTFNDRLRDSVRGGSPFGDRDFQGFITELGITWNGLTGGDEAQRLERALLFADRIRVGLAGNLKDYTFVGADGAVISGADVDYNGAPTGYTLDPQENIVYIDKHDNETLFDIIAYKDLDITTAERARIQNVGNSLVMFSQGVPFFQAGTDMLRSKSLDRDSYNSGDWFNRLDFTYQTNNWGVGLPPQQSNSAMWPVMEQLLAKEGIQPTPDDIMSAVMNFRELLQIRRSSPLFRLRSGADVMERVHFYNTGPEQIPGLIVMRIADAGEGLADIDPQADHIVVVFNARPDAVGFVVEELAGMDFRLHPIQANSYDPIVRRATYDPSLGIFAVPGRTTAVFIAPQ